MSYFFSRLEATCVPAWTRLRAACRAAGVEVMYTVIQSLTANGRDRGLDYVISGFHVPPGSWDAQVRAGLGAGVRMCVSMLRVGAELGCGRREGRRKRRKGMWCAMVFGTGHRVANS